MFGDVVRARRLERGWTQEVLARKIGVTAPYISMIENKQRGQEPGYDVLVLLAEAFHTTVEELRAAAKRDEAFPTAELIALGLKPAIATRLEAEWATLPIKRRAGLLRRAKDLARAYTEIAQAEAGLSGEEEEEQPAGQNEIH